MVVVVVAVVVVVVVVVVDDDAHFRSRPHYLIYSLGNGIFLYEPYDEHL